MIPPTDPPISATTATTRNALSAPRRRLLHLMQCIRFGQVLNLTVRDGEPVFEPTTRAVRDIRFGKRNTPHEMQGANEFALKQEVIEMFSIFDADSTAFIQRLDVVDGLPRSMSISTPVAE